LREEREKKERKRKRRGGKHTTIVIPHKQGKASKNGEKK
jgi:hypothetical protein